MTDLNDLPDLYRLQADRKQRVDRAADELAHAKGLAAWFPADYIDRLHRDHERAVQAFERGERGLT